AVRLVPAGGLRPRGLEAGGELVAGAFPALRAAEPAGPRARGLRAGPGPRPGDLDRGPWREAAAERRVQGRLPVALQQGAVGSQPAQPRRRVPLLADAAPIDGASARREDLTPPARPGTLDP